jgi:hypothetical protein
MNRLLPILLLAAVITGVIIFRRDPVPPAMLPVTPATAVQPTTAESPTPAPATYASATNPATPAPAESLSNEITRALRSGSPAERDHAFNVLLPRLIAEDPAAAGHLALAWEPGPLRDEFLRHVIRLWASADIGGTVTWLVSLLDEPDRLTAATAATAQVAQSDPAGAIELSALLRTNVEDGSLERLAQLWTEEKPREAQAWIVEQPASALRDRLLARIAHVRAQQEPAEAASLVLNHLAPGDTRDAAFLNVVRQWAVRDPASATAWVAQFPAGPLHTRALAELDIARKISPLSR